MVMIYKITKFNKKKFNFLNVLNNFLKKKNLVSLKYLIFNSKKKDFHKLKKIFYNFFKTKELKNVYK